MNNHITKSTLLSLGTDLGTDDVDALVDRLNQKLELLVGDEIIESLTEEDVQTLVDMQDTATDEELGEWITEHVPDYPEIIQDNVAIVLGDFADTLPSAVA